MKKNSTVKILNLYKKHIDYEEMFVPVNLVLTLNYKCDCFLFNITSNLYPKINEFSLKMNNHYGFMIITNV